VAPGRKIDAPSIISMKVADDRYGSFEAVHSPGSRWTRDTIRRMIASEITGTKGVLWITRGHGQLLDVAQ